MKLFAKNSSHHTHDIWRESEREREKCTSNELVLIGMCLLIMALVDCSGNGLGRFAEATDGGLPIVWTAKLVSLPNASRSEAFDAFVPLLCVTVSTCGALVLCRGIGMGANVQWSPLSMFTSRSIDGRGGFGMRGGTGGVICLSVYEWFIVFGVIWQKHTCTQTSEERQK